MSDRDRIAELEAEVARLQTLHCGIDTQLLPVVGGLMQFLRDAAASPDPVAAQIAMVEVGPLDDDDPPVPTPLVHLWAAVASPRGGVANPLDRIQILRRSLAVAIAERDALRAERDNRGATDE